MSATSIGRVNTNGNVAKRLLNNINGNKSAKCKHRKRQRTALQPWNGKNVQGEQLAQGVFIGFRIDDSDEEDNNNENGILV